MDRTITTAALTGVYAVALVLLMAAHSHVGALTEQLATANTLLADAYCPDFLTTGE